MYFNGTRSYFLAACLFASVSLMAKDKVTTGGHGLRKPLCFVENKGQVTDQDNNQRVDIQYKLSTPGMSLYIGNGQLHYQFKEVKGTDAASVKVSGYRMDVTLLGADQDAKVISTEKHDYYENYFLGQLPGDGITARSYDKIIYKNVYPHIDWVLYVKDNKVEYDFVVRPGGNVQDIKLRYDGATALSMDEDGSINAETPMGKVQEHRPYAYEKASGKAVATDFVLHDNVVTFATGDYRGTLTIDPYLLFSTYFGGGGEDVVTSVKETTTGITFAGGYTNSHGLGTAGVFNDSMLGGTYDAFLAKYDATGALKFVSYFGGTGTDQGTCIALDNTGAGNPFIYLVGSTNSANIRATVVGSTTPLGGMDGFIAKFTNVGGLQWGRFFGGTKDDNIYGVTVDAANNVYITGQTASTTGISLGVGIYQPAMKGINDAFVTKLNGATGAVTWSTYYGGTAQDASYAIALDASNDVFITGQTNSIINISTNGTVLSGTNDAFIAKFNSGGTSLLWGTYFGGTGEEQGNGIVCDQVSGNVSLVGVTTSPTGTGIASANAFQQLYAGGPQDAFVATYSNTGVLSWSSYYGGNAPDYGQGICLDMFGNVVISGGTFSSSGIASPSGTFTAAAFQNAIGGDYDAFVAKFNALGQRLWGSYFGGLLYDYANAIACDNTDQLTIGGFTTDNLTYGTGGIATAGAAQGTNSGGTYDGFITKFKADTLVQIVQPYTDVLVCLGGTLTVKYTTNFNFKPGNVFTVQLSDVFGSFSSATNIGSLTSNVPGTITCVIPPLIATGTRYRIRVVSNSPVYVSPDDFYDITVISALPATTASGSTPACVGSTITLNDVAPYTVTGYSWTGPATSGLGGAGFTAAIQNPSNTGFSGLGVSKADSGLYYVTTTHNGCAARLDSVNIVVNDVVPPPTIDSTAAINCDGHDLYLYANPDTTVAGLTYIWTGPSGFSSTAQNPVILGATSANAGTYTVNDILGGCVSPTSIITVTITPVTPDTIRITASPGDTVCGGTMVTFSARTVNGGVTPGYQWMSAPFTPITGAISNTFASSSLLDAETIFCVMTSNAICPSPSIATSNIIKMNVITTPPVAYITASPSAFVPLGSTITFNSSVFNEGVGAQYQWKLNGVDIPGSTSSTLVLPGITQNDTISLELTSTMNCANPNTVLSNVIVIGTNVGVANITPSLENIVLFPNPNNGSFTVKGNCQGMNTNNLSFEVLNPVGQVLYRDNAMVHSNLIDKAIDLNNIPDGIYLLHVYNEEQGKTIRFTVQR